MTLSRKSIDQTVSPFYDEWSALSQEVKSCFDHEASDCHTLIAQGGELYEALKEALYGLFGNSAPSPLNESERLEFVRSSRSAHAASRQLAQLFEELKKKIARTKIGYPAE
ncbi:YpoC family protein [Planococcus sp. SSTMD024]|uniref:YpoC family protein n=1 Tax=Planococcus sp. SSTMD024 TaxID=3242163 RepID=UPI00351F7AE8